MPTATNAATGAAFCHRRCPAARFDKLRRLNHPTVLAAPSICSPSRSISLEFSHSRNISVIVSASASASSSSFDGPDSDESKKNIILNLVQEIEPLDVSLIQKDVPANTVDAMKRTISGMLGLLPSAQFNVQIEALWGPLSKLLTSSMKTGYTLRNAEYRMCLERNLDIHEENTGKKAFESVAENDTDESLGNGSAPSHGLLVGNDAHSGNKNEGGPLCRKVGAEDLDGVTSEAKEYIRCLQSRLESTEKELHDIKRKISALQMQQFVGEEKNDLLDYLRSLQPEKVSELSETTCPGVEESIHSVVHGLLATLSPRMHSKLPPLLENATGESLGIKKDDYAELAEDTSVQFQPLISVPRDYLARLLFWCMLLGHYIRGLEYRLDLMQLFRISSDVKNYPM